MSSESVPLRPPMTRDAAGTLLGQTMGLVAVTAALFAVGAYLGRNLAAPWGWLLFIAAFACLIAMNAAVHDRRGSPSPAVRVRPAHGRRHSADAQLLASAIPGGLAGGRSDALFLSGFGLPSATRSDLSAFARILFWP